MWKREFGGAFKLAFASDRRLIDSGVNVLFSRVGHCWLLFMDAPSPGPSPTEGRGDFARPVSRPQCIPCVRFAPRPLRFVKGTLLGEDDRWLGVGDADSALV